MQTADIIFDKVADGQSNFTPIGWYDYGSHIEHYFNGTYDGSGHTIKNLTIDDAQSSGLGMFVYVGIRGRIQNVNLINANVNGGYGYGVGGLVGCNEGTVKNCTTTGGTVNGYENVGGLVGYNEYGTIENCTTSGTVNGEYGVGGLVGYNEIRHSQELFG